MAFFQHKDCGCQAREPIIGGRYRWMSRNLLTGEETGWKYVTCVDVEPIRNDKFFCRRVTLLTDDGREFKPQLYGFWGRYQSVNNIVQFRGAA